MKITKEWLAGHGACEEGMEWFAAQEEADGVKLVEKLMAEDRFDWANWLIVRIMTRPQYLGYAICAAEQVIGIYEARYPDDSRPRAAIVAARRVMDDDSAGNRDAAWDAWEAAGEAAGEAAWAAREAAWAAREAARAASWEAARAAREAAREAAWAARAAAGEAAWAAMQRRLTNHGLELIREA